MVVTDIFSVHIVSFYRVINGRAKDRCVDMFSALSYADNGPIGGEKNIQLAGIVVRACKFSRERYKFTGRRKWCSLVGAFLFVSLILI